MVPEAPSSACTVVDRVPAAKPQASTRAPTSRPLRGGRGASSAKGGRAAWPITCRSRHSFGQASTPPPGEGGTPALTRPGCSGPPASLSRFLPRGDACSPSESWVSLSASPGSEPAPTSREAIAGETSSASGGGEYPFSPGENTFSHSISWLCHRHPTTVKTPGPGQNLRSRREPMFSRATSVTARRSFRLGGGEPFRAHADVQPGNAVQGPPDLNVAEGEQHLAGEVRVARPHHVLCKEALGAHHPHVPEGPHVARDDVLAQRAVRELQDPQQARFRAPFRVCRVTRQHESPPRRALERKLCLLPEQMRARRSRPLVPPASPLRPPVRHWNVIRPHVCVCADDVVPLRVPPWRDRLPAVER